MIKSIYKKYRNLDPDHLLISTIIVFMVISFGILTFIEKQQHAQSDGWSLSFVDPDNTSTGFLITNHTKDPAFHYEILSNDISIQSGDLYIPPAEKRIIPIEKMNDQNTITMKIIVTNDDEQKNIYK